MTPAERLLQFEYETLLPILRELDPPTLAKPTVCTEWSIIDIVAHVGSALGYIASGQTYDNSPSGNQREVDQRRSWPAAKIIDEYERGLLGAAGKSDGAALGTWIHGGDIRAALELDDAYASPGFDDAITLLSTTDRVASTPKTQVKLPHRELSLGPACDSSTAVLECDVASLFCLYTGRPADPARYRLTGAEPGDLVSHQW
jgi:uncharacterized protein (TIGR03083 family)